MQNSFKNLKIYEKSYKAAKAIYLSISSKFPEEERYGLKSQINRASMSIPLNIAEGYSKGDSTREMLRFMYMARGSVSEVLVLLDFAKDFAFITEKEHESATKEYSEIGRMLTKFIQNYKKQTHSLFANHYSLRG